MSSKSGFWRGSMFRLGSWLQLLQRRENSGAGRRNHSPAPSSAAVIRYRHSNSSVFPMFKFVGCRRAMSSNFLSSRVKQQTKEKEQTTDTPFLFSFFLPTWAKWIFGSLLCLLIPTWKQTWGKLQTLEGEAEMMIEEGERVAEAVEKVAELTEKVTAKIAEKLPEGSKLKEAAQVVESYSKEIAHDAQLTQHFLHKVEEWKHMMEKSETVTNGQHVKEEECKAQKLEENIVNYYSHFKVY